jgi:UPF0716 protein FxsA
MRLLLLLLPWLELLTLIQLGVAIGALSALAYVFLTLVAGILLLRLQGRDMFRRLREAQEGRLFGPQIFVDDMAVGLAALLLMVPGMITDIAALLVLFGPLRRRLSRWLFGPREAPEGSGPGPDPSGPSSGPTTIEGEWRRVDDERRP